MKSRSGHGVQRDVEKKRKNKVASDFLWLNDSIYITLVKCSEDVEVRIINIIIRIPLSPTYLFGECKMTYRGDGRERQRESD